jgi:hypothetical protein
MQKPQQAAGTYTATEKPFLLDFSNSEAYPPIAAFWEH